MIYCFPSSFLNPPLSLFVGGPTFSSSLSLHGSMEKSQRFSSLPRPLDPYEFPFFHCLHDRVFVPSGRPISFSWLIPLPQTRHTPHLPTHIRLYFFSFPSSSLDSHRPLGESGLLATHLPFLRLDLIWLQPLSTFHLFIFSSSLFIEICLL